MLKELKKEVDNINPSNVNLYYILKNRKDKDNVDYRVENIKIDKSIGSFFLDNVSSFIDKKLALNEEKIEYLDYDPDTNIDRNIVLKIAKTEVDLVEEYLEKLESLQQSDSKKLKQKNLWGYIVYFNDIDLYMFKKTSSGKVTLKSKGILNAVISDGVLNAVENDLISFDDKVDCLLFKDDILIFNKHNFEKVFDFFDKMFEIVKDKINDLKNKGYVKDTDNLFLNCKNDARKIKKLRTILKSEALNSIKKEKFSSINEEFGLGLSFDDDGNIEVDEEKSWQILALLNDDYLNSGLTELNYEAQGKIKK